MREIVFDTETTGLDYSEDRIIEIGAVELENRFVTGRSFHVYLNPQGKKMHPDALAVHGITDEQLFDKPKFSEIIDGWLTFTNGAKLVAHNARFDVGFFNAELARIGFPPINDERVIDSLVLARRRNPMGKNSLDALCKKYGIDNSKREKHGALLDSELLAEVYIELVGGKQVAMSLDNNIYDNQTQTTALNDDQLSIQQRSTPWAVRLSDAEIKAHFEMVKTIGEKSLWYKD